MYFIFGLAKLLFRVLKDARRRRRQRGAEFPSPADILVRFLFHGDVECDGFAG